MKARIRQIANEVMLVVITTGIIVAAIMEVRQRNDARRQARNVLDSGSRNRDEIRDSLQALRWYQDDESVALKARLRARLKRGWLRL